MHMRSFLPAMAAGLTLSLFTAPAHAQSYSFQDIGSLGGQTTVAGALNNSGQVVGYSQLTDTTYRAVLFDQAGLHNLGLLPGATGTRLNSYALDINNSGVICGIGNLSNARQRGFRYASSTFTQLAPISSNDMGDAFGINASGQVAGSSSGVAARWNANTTTPTSLGRVGDPFAYNATFSQGINDAGQVVGYAFLANGGGTRAFRTAANAAINPNTDDIGTLGGTSAYAAFIDSTGQVVGNSSTTTGATHAFRTRANQNINAATDDLGVLDGYLDSSAASINTQGLIVGSVDQGTDAQGNSINQRAVLYQNGAILDLNTYLPADFGWTLNFASDINDRGQIVASGVNASGVQHGFLITPTPAPPGVVSLLIGAGVMVVGAGRRRRSLPS